MSLMNILGLKYKEYDPNPLEWTKDKSNINDCAIRAMTKLLNMSWQEVYHLLSETAINETGLLVNCTRNIRIVLEKYGYKFETCQYITIGEKLYKTKGTPCMIGNKEHVVYVDEKGCIYDKRSVLDKDLKKPGIHTSINNDTFLGSRAKYYIYKKEKK